jgi:hypothetical protein
MMNFCCGGGRETRDGDGLSTIYCCCSMVFVLLEDDDFGR